MPASKAFPITFAKNTNADLILLPVLNYWFCWWSSTSNGSTGDKGEKNTLCPSSSVLARGVQLESNIKNS